LWLNHPSMPVATRSFAKINLGLRIGALRADGFHELHTVYQTIGLHDVVRVRVERGRGIEIRSEDPRVPKGETNTCYRMVECVMNALAAKGRVVVEIEKRLPVQGGLGGASANAVASLLALERALKKQLSGPEKLRIAAEVGSDLPLFLVGGTVLGVGRGQEVYPLPDLPGTPCVVATPRIGVSTPKAFADWDAMVANEAQSSAPDLGKTAAEHRSARTGEDARPYIGKGEGGGGSTPLGRERGETANRAEDVAKLTHSSRSDRMMEFGRNVSAWLSGLPQGRSKPGRPSSGVPARGRGRAGSPLLDLVRTGIENDFEQVVFPQYPELGEVKCLLQEAGAMYASLSGSGSAVYGLFRSRVAAGRAGAALRRKGVPVQVTTTLTRQQYWGKIF
jgi:4-diphosphocytidyl-2-C-methyl-D-erythritol kinase